ncbi:MAG: hypothetical protein WC208_07340 [Gallionella sp.]|jgi:hypothetical protein
MRSIFLSASVPLSKGRGDYYMTANPYLIQCAVRELVLAVIRHHKIVWGGHPSITPMIWSICEGLGVEYSKKVTLYQSRYFDGLFPDENKRFGNVIYTDSIPEDQDASLLLMRKAMLSRDDLDAGVFIGGMEGVEAEYELFRKFHPNATVLPVAAPGGAALLIAKQLGYSDEAQHNIDFVNLFHTHLDITKNDYTIEDHTTDSDDMKPKP